MPGEQNPEANRQQLRRCLDHETLTPEAWSRAIAGLLPRDKWVLALDRTEWKRGETTTNLLVLAVVVHGCSVPLLWTVLPDCGASDTKERMELLSRFVTLFGKERMRFVTADREFIGREWIGWLLKEQIPSPRGYPDSDQGRRVSDPSRWTMLACCRLVRSESLPL